MSSFPLVVIPEILALEKNEVLSVFIIIICKHFLNTFTV